jgi:hypothetical protein
MAVLAMEVSHWILAIPVRLCFHVYDFFISYILQKVSSTERGMEFLNATLYYTVLKVSPKVLN